jgi:predicted alpha-1,6-mannanase (GH76 family)
MKGIERAWPMVTWVTIAIAACLLLAPACSDPDSAAPSDNAGGSTMVAGAGGANPGKDGAGGQSGSIPTDASTDGSSPAQTSDASPDGASQDDSSPEPTPDAPADRAASSDVTTGDSTSSDAAQRDANSSDAALLPGCDAAVAHDRADRALSAMLVGLWNGTQQYFDAAEPPNGRLAYYWTFALAVDSVLDGVERTNGLHYRGLIRSLYAGQAARGWSSYYYDDETWMALMLIRAYDMMGDRAYLDTAVTIYREIMGGWDATSAHPGGIWWSRAKTKKVTASNGGPVIIGAELSKRTGDATFLTFARQVYDFWFKTMVDPATHAVFDGLLADGTIDRGGLTYNEGVMVGAARALYVATGASRFLQDANDIAQALIKYRTMTSTLGPVLSDGSNTQCIGDCPVWKVTGYRYLAALYPSAPLPEYRMVLEVSAQAAWTLARNSTTGFFANDWRGPPMSTAAIEAETSSASALNLFASLCGPYPTNSSDAYEAEDAVLDHVGLDATHAGFSGWGYVAGWTGAQQSVEFDLQAISDGNYDVLLDYAAAAGDAIRSLTVNRVVVQAQLRFPSTGSWDKWSEITTRVHLSAGANAIKLTYESTGSAASLNLDKLRLVPAPATEPSESR